MDCVHDVSIDPQYYSHKDLDEDTQFAKKVATVC